MKTTAYWSYKTCIKDRLRELRQRRGVMTQAFIADRLGVQASYISRVLNNEKVQFSEDQLYRILKVLGFSEDEREFLFLLRAYEVTSLVERRAEIELRIRKIQAHDPGADLANLSGALKEILKAVSRISEEDQKI